MKVTRKHFNQEFLIDNASIFRENLEIFTRCCNHSDLSAAFNLKLRMIMFPGAK